MSSARRRLRAVRGQPRWFKLRTAGAAAVMGRGRRVRVLLREPAAATLGAPVGGCAKEVLDRFAEHA